MLVCVSCLSGHLHELSFGNTDEKKDLSQPGEFCAFPDPYLALTETFSCLRSDDW